MKNKFVILFWVSAIITGSIIGTYILPSIDATQRATLPETKAENGDQEIEFNGITYINCAKNPVWDAVQCYMVINNTKILCTPDGMYSTAMNPLCAHIIIDYELDRRGL